MLRTLFEAAERDTSIKAVLRNMTFGHSEAARRITRDLGYSTSEAAVRRYRRLHVAAPAPEKTSSVPKDMPVFTEYDGPNGRAALHLPRAGYSEEDLLREAGFDPDSWRISGNVNHRKWMRYDQEWLFYYKFDVEQGESVKARKIHVDDLVKRIQKRSQRKDFYYGGYGTYVIVLSDWQIGKSEGGKGSEDTVARWKDCLAQAKADIIRLRRSGVDISRLAVLSVGDLVEGCGDHYDMQTFLVDLDRRNQNRVVREMVTETLLTLVPMFDHATVACIGGNHGENRRKGKAFTTFADNDDVATIEAVKEAFDLAGWDTIDWVIPDDELSLNVNISGVNVGLVHGHQFKGGANAWKKMEDWWRGGDFGLQDVQKSQILVSGHFHFNTEVNVSANRSWFQAPTIDPGSKWYTDFSGTSAIPGVLTFVATSENPLGYDFKRILCPRETEQIA